MNQLLIIFFTFLPFVGVSQIAFEASYEKTFRRAEKEDKLVFVYAYTDWSAQCEALEQHTFTDMEATRFFNANFINLRLDVEAYPGLELMELYEIYSLPTLLVMNAAQEVVHRSCGAIEAAELLELGQQALTVDNNLLTFEEDFYSDSAEVNDVLKYLAAREYACLEVEMFVKNYLGDDPHTLIDEKKWAVFEEYHWDIFSAYFKELVANRSRYEEAYGRQVVEAKLYNMFLAQYQEVYVAEQLHDFGMRALLDAISSLEFDGADTLKAMMAFHYAEVSEDWAAYATEAIRWVVMSGLDDAEELNEIAWKFYLFVDNHTHLEIATAWLRAIIDEQPTPSYIDTYASLLYKQGEKKQAIALAEKALELAQELGQSAEHYQHQLRKFRR